MKKYIEYFILIFIIIFLSIILILDKKNKINYVLPQIPKISKMDINKIIIKKGEKKVIKLLKKQNRWIINNKYRADTKKIDFILNDSSNLKLLSMVSKGGDYGRYFLDDKNKIYVSIWKGNKKLLGFSIGKLAPNYTSTYVKLENKSPIYLAEGNLKLTFDTDIDDLRDKKVLIFKKDHINKITINIEGKTKTIEKDNEKWISKNEILKKQDIDSLIEKLNNMELASFLKQDNNKKTSPYVEIKLIGRGKEYFLKIMKVKEGKETKYIGISSSVKENFILDKYVVQELINICKELFKNKK